MGYTHEEMKEMLADYHNGLIEGDTRHALEGHLQECSHCREELYLISELTYFKAPDPGELFWKTLPAKVSRLAKQEEKGVFSLKHFFRPVPAFVSAMLLVIVAISSVYIISGMGTALDPFYEEPLSYSMLDYDGISENDLPAIIEEWPDDSMMEEDIVEEYGTYSYHMEIAYLDQDEFENLIEVLKENERKEG